MRFASPAPRRARLGWALACAAVLCGCAAGPPRGGSPGSPPEARPSPRADADGPPLDPPADLALRPDAEPRLEPIRQGGPNKPYQALGRDYVPATRDVAFSERGLASWYGRKFHGRRTASGEVYDMYAMTAAHPTLPIPSYARIRNPANGREVLVRVNDRGPFVAGRIVDLSYAAASKLDLLRGVAPVQLERITFEDIRTGAWRGNRTDPLPPAPGVAEVVAVAEPPVQEIAYVARPADPAPAAAEAGRGFWIQLGAYRERAGAETFRRRVNDDAEAGWLEPMLAIFGDTGLWRVQAGPYPSRDEADAAARRARASLGVAPVVVERR